MRSDGVVFLVGASGSGKTVIARRAAEITGWSLYDTDAEVLARSGAKRISDVFDTHGEAYFRRLESESLTEILAMESPVIVATGGGLPGIPGMMEKLNQIGSSIYLKASVSTLWKRLNTDPRQLEDRPLLRGEGQGKLEQLIEKREPAYSKASVVVDTDQLSVDEVCSLLVTQIGSMQKTAEPTGQPSST